MKLIEPFVCESNSSRFTFDGESWSNAPHDALELFLLEAWTEANRRTHADLTELAVECAAAVLQDFRVIEPGLAQESDVPDDAEG